MADEKMSRKDFLKKLGCGALVAGLFCKFGATPVMAGVSDNLPSGSGGVKVDSEAPANPNMLWINTSDGNLPYYNNGTTWVPVPTFHKSSAKPVDTSVPWLDTSTGVLYYNNGSAWANMRSVWGQTTK